MFSVGSEIIKLSSMAPFLPQWHTHYLSLKISVRRLATLVHIIWEKLQCFSNSVHKKPFSALLAIKGMSACLPKTQQSWPIPKQRHYFVQSIYPRKAYLNRQNFSKIKICRRSLPKLSVGNPLDNLSFKDVNTSECFRKSNSKQNMLDTDLFNEKYINPSVGLTLLSIPSIQFSSYIYNV